MAISRKLIATGLAGLAMIATTAAASAAPAYATSNVNVRTGPGTGYAVIDALRRGEQVDVQYCRGSWCFVQKRGPDGWVSASYLDRGGRPGWNDHDGWNRPPHWDPRPPRWDHHPPRPPHWDPRPPRPPHHGYPRPPYPTQPGASFCYNGPNGYFCIGD
ncbi:SH3 domain-containing protein [Devosia sp. PTR5]|uniref:SH3 domain-containing protein n=1 Tax=Devosia oryzisoli TaxID=2774138 RepID=A0A927IRR2_9HYPH|nr:SH3 domain-containing protein [Devosia oryzisoli]MBD8063976.1 SH3 domain-containing protein [Devosia oryzisoli]